MAGAGNGTYGVGNIQAGTGQDRYAGWALVIAYQNAAENMRNLRVYDGFGVVSGSQTSVNIPIGGFQTPQYGQVTTRIGTVVYEGDMGKTGDTLQLNGQSMTDSANPANNFFNSTVSDGGALVTDRNPDNGNLLGVDIDQFDASGKLGNNVTGATLTLTTASGGETFYPGVVTFTTDLYAPNLSAVMAGSDVNGGELLPGDEIAYTIDVKNDGTDTAIESVLTDAVPAGTTYVPGTLTVDGVPVSDAAGNDIGEFRTDSAQGAAVLRIGSGANATTGGKLIPNATTRVTLRVRVDLSTPAGFTVLNKAAVDYTGENTGRKIAGTSSAAGVTVKQPRADLSAGLTVAPALVQRGGAADAVAYQLSVTNNGADLEPRATATLTLPSGVTAGPLPAPCSVTGQVVTCDMGPLAVGTTLTRQIDALANASAAASAVAQAAAAGTGNDTVPGNNTASAALTVNTAPTAVPDSAGTTHRAPVTVPVLDNDTDPDNPALTVTVQDQPEHGAAAANADGTVTYTPEDGFAGADTFTYRVSDGRGGVAVGTVTVTVANAAPVALPDTAGGAPGRPVTVTVLDNDRDPNGDPLTITAVSRPAGGTAAFSGGTVTFTPSTAFAGVARFTYTVSDGKGGETTADVAVEIDNAAPHAMNDSISTPYRTDVVVPVLAGDTDPNEDPLTVTSVTQPADGSVTLAGGVVTYRAAERFSGTTTFTYTISDGKGGEDTGTVTVTVDNAPPFAADVTASGPHGRPVRIDVVARANDPNDDPMHVSATGTPAHGAVTVDSDGTLIYVPGERFSGDDTFTVEISDNHGGTDTARVTVRIANGLPVALADAVTAEANQPLTVPVLANDSDPNRDPLTVDVDNGPDHGAAVVEADGTVTYTPVSGYVGTDSFHYTVDDGNGGTTGATVTITVINSPPVAHDDADVTPTDTAVTLDVLLNDADASGDELTVTGFTNGARGTVTAGGAGRLVYTPEPGFAGTDTFTYAVEDPARGTSGATVTVTVLNAPPIAVDDTVRVRPGIRNPLRVLTNDTDPNPGQVLRIRSVTGAAKGTPAVGPAGTVTYIPQPGATGTDTFDYTVTDDAGGLATATVTVTIDLPPTATHDVATTPSGTAVVLTVLTNDTDPERRPLTVTAVAAPRHGTAVLAAGNTVRYVPEPGFIGTDTFSYTIRDAAGNTDIATAAVTVANALPTARPDVAGVAAGGRIEIPVLVNDDDVNPGQTLSVGSIGAPTHGTVTRLAGGRVRYVPAPGYVGPDSFTYVVSDGAGGASFATVSVTVTDGVPVALPDETSTPYRRSVAVRPLLNDLDPHNDALRIVGVAPPATGTVAFTGDTLTYTPAAGFSGAVRLTYSMADTDGNTAQSTVTVTVGTPPAVPDKQAVAPPGAPVTIPLPLVDKHKRPVTVIEVGTPRNGTARLGPDGQVVYTPEEGFFGTDSFTYTAKDVDGNLASATVKVTVAGPAKPPVARNDAVTVPVGGSVVIRPTTNDTDPNGDKLTIVKISKPRHGSAVLSGGTVTYAPARGYAGGTDSFAYTISDGHGGTATATVTVTVEEAPAPDAARLPRPARTCCRWPAPVAWPCWSARRSTGSASAAVRPSRCW